MKVYVPVNDINDYACYTVFDSNTIRAYKQTPTINANNEYTDFDVIFIICTK